MGRTELIKDIGKLLKYTTNIEVLCIVKCLLAKNLAQERREENAANV